MLDLRHNPAAVLDQNQIDHLASLQRNVDFHALHSKKADEAERMWNGKSGSKANAGHWEKIKSKLIDLAVGVEICNYCEQSEASDIEHVAPKGLFPEMCFAWDNYILACKNCNSGYKLDAMWIFNPANGTHAEYVKRGTIPNSKDLAFINPRKEDPMAIMELDWNDFAFYPKTDHEPGSREFLKWEKTEEILELNKRPALPKYRRLAFDSFKHALHEYVNVGKAKSHAEIDEVTLGNPKVDPAIDLKSEKDRIQTAIKDSILTSLHPTVFREMQKQMKNLPQGIRNLLHESGAIHW